MKRLFVIACCLALTLRSDAQDYHPFMTGIDSVTFMRMYCFEGCNSVIFRVPGHDTAFYMDSTWRPIYEENNGITATSLLGWLQEDTAARKVYYHLPYNMSDSTKLLLYDFSLALGDTTLVWAPWSDWTWGGDTVPIGTFRVDSISTYETLVGPRRVLHLTDINSWGTNQLHWMEGIGDLEKLFWGGSIYYLTCRFNNDIHAFKWTSLAGSPELDTTCTPSSPGFVPQPFSKETVRISPNPVTDVCSIVLNDASNLLLHVAVYSHLGQPVLQMSGQGTTAQMSLAGLPVGYYNVVLQTRKGSIVRPLLKK